MQMPLNKVRYRKEKKQRQRGTYPNPSAATRETGREGQIVNYWVDKLIMIFPLARSLHLFYWFDNLNIRGTKFFRIVKLNCININRFLLLLLIFKSNHSIIQWGLHKHKISIDRSASKLSLANQPTNLKMVLPKLLKWG